MLVNEVKSPMFIAKYLGPAVHVGVSMFVLSISELSEVGMVRMWML